MSEGPTPAPPTPPPIYPRRRSFMGPVVLITLGTLFLIAEFVPRLDFGDLWPILLIAIGAVKLYEYVSWRN
jgi:hypothetical protein